MNDNDPISRLTRFSPLASGLNRDELLFLAGQASVRTPRIWKGLTFLLVLSQALTLSFWLLRNKEEAPNVAPVIPIIIPPQDPTLSEPSPPDPNSYLVLMRRADMPRTPKSEDHILPDRTEVPLNAGSRNFD